MKIEFLTCFYKCSRLRKSISSFISHIEMKCVFCFGLTAKSVTTSHSYYYANHTHLSHTLHGYTQSSTLWPLQFSVKGPQCCPVPPDSLSVNPSGSGAWQRGDKALRLQCTLAYIAEQYAGWTTEQLAQDHGDGSSLGAIQEGE